MAKYNTKQKQSYNYFTQNIQNKGEDFLQKKNAAELKQDAYRVFLDLAKGKIDPERDAEYILYPPFVEAAIALAEEKFLMSIISRDGVSMLISAYGNNVGNETRAVLDHHTKAAEGYNLILGCLNQLKYTGDIHYIYSTVSQLRQFRNFI